MVSAWRNFKNIFPRPLFIIIFRPEMLKFHPYSMLTGDTRVEFVISCVLIIKSKRQDLVEGIGIFTCCLTLENYKTYLINFFD
jgi:hypothetical protein